MLGFASPWPPSPTLLITSRPSGMRWSRVGCLSLGIDSPPFYGPPLCPIRPIFKPHTTIIMCNISCFGRAEGIVANNKSPQPRDRDANGNSLAAAPSLSHRF